MHQLLLLVILLILIFGLVPTVFLAAVVLIVLEEEVPFVLHDVVERIGCALELESLAVVELRLLLLLVLLEPLVQVRADRVDDLGLVVLIEGEDRMFTLFESRLLVAVLNSDQLLER